MAVSAIWDDDGGNKRGALWMLFLNEDGTVEDHQKISSTEGGFYGTLDDDDNFGGTPALLGDLDGDEVPDLAVGAYLDDDGGADRGAVWVLFMAPDLTGVDDAAAASPPAPASRLLASVPNPFNPKTTIHYELARPGDASLLIYDAAGRLVRSFELNGRLAGVKLCRVGWNE